VPPESAQLNDFCVVEVECVSNPADNVIVGHGHGVFLMISLNGYLDRIFLFRVGWLFMVFSGCRPALL
jgi:hypothetical protein